MHFFFVMAAQKASAKVAVVNVSESSKESEGNSPVSKVTSYMPATYWRRKSSIDIFHENFSCELPIIIRITLNIYCWKIDFTRAYRQNNWNIVQQDCFEVNLQSWTSYFWYFTNFFFTASVIISKKCCIRVTSQVAKQLKENLKISENYNLVPSRPSKFKIFLILAESCWKIEIKVFLHCAILHEI